MAPDHLYQKPADVRTRTGAGGIVVRREGGCVLVALIREYPHPDYVLPKGGVEKGETLEEAAAREITEEAGFTKLKCLGEIGVGERLNSKRSVWQTTHYFLFLTDQVDAKATEAGRWELGWFDIERLPEMYWREQRQMIETNRAKIRELVMAR